MNSAGSLQYDAKPRKRRWSAKRLVVLGLITAAGAGWRWWPVVWSDMNLIAGRIQLHTTRLPSNALAIDTTGAVLIPPPSGWVRFYRACEGSDSNDAAVVYLDWRASPDGQRRLVELAYRDGGAKYNCEWRTFDMEPWISRPNERESSNAYQGFYRSTKSGWDHFTGTSDPADLSHFTIRSTQGGRELFEDGYLMNDGTVRLETRPFPFSGRPAGAPAGRVPLRNDR